MVQSAYSIRELDDLLDEERTLTSELEACRRRSGGGGDGLDASDVESMMGKLEHSTERQDILVRKDEEEMEMEDLASRLGRIWEVEDGLRRLRDRVDDRVSRIAESIVDAPAFDGLHALCVGPGLGRHPVVFAAVGRVLRGAMDRGLALVLDADALYMLSLPEYRGLLDDLREYDRCVMTPNVVEARRLDGGGGRGRAKNGEAAAAGATFVAAATASWFGRGTSTRYARATSRCAARRRGG